MFFHGERQRPRLPVDAEAEARFDGYPAEDAVFESSFPEDAVRSGVDDSGALPSLDVLAAAPLEHDAADALAEKEVAEREPGDACSDDQDGSVQVSAASRYQVSQVERALCTY